MILFYDTETSGLPQKGFPIDDPAQPWIKQVGALFTDLSGERVYGRLQAIINADGRKGRPGAEEVHGISDRDSALYGVNELGVFSILTHWMRKVRFVVGFGLEFDQFCTESVIRRAKKDPAAWKRPGVKWICLRDICVPVCKIPSEHESGTYRWPSLDAACATVLGEAAREGQHDAWDDMEKTRRLFIALKGRQLLNLEDE